MTARIFMFMLALLGLLTLGVGAVVWYARGSFYVGLEGEQVAIYRGRPQPVMWFKPTIAERTNINVKDVLPNDATRLREGTVRHSLQSSHNYVHALVTSANEARKIKDPNGPAVVEPQFSNAADSTPATTATTIAPNASTSAPATKSTPEVSAAKR